MASLKQIVVEIGCENLRCGFSGDANPRFTVGHTMLDETVPLRIYFNELFQRVFIHHLHVKSKQYNVLLVERLLLPRNIRDMLVSVLLRDFQVQAVSIQPDLLLGILSSGTSSGTILNIGSRECQSLCFVNGRALMHTLQDTTVGVSHAVEAFQHRLESSVEKSVDAEAAAAIFRRAACCPFVDTDGVGSSVADLEVLPVQGFASTGVTIPGHERVACLQGLITGVRADGEWVDERGGAAGILLESLRLCNNDVRHRAAEHIVIMGGGAMIPGICESICRHATHISTSPEYEATLKCVVQKLPGQRLRVVPTVFERRSLAWVGGSLFASIKENKPSFVTLQDLIQRGKFSTPSTSNPGGSGADAASLARVGAASAKENFVLTAPDWQSLDAKDWVFCQTSVVVSST